MLKSPNQTDPSIPLQKALKGRYWLERELGRGAMGVVYLAEEVALDRMVALKLLPPHLAADPERRERFLREARTAAKLSHPGIVPIFAVDEVDDFVFFTMAYVEGRTLARRIRAGGPLALDDATRVLRDVAWAVAYAHAQGVIHRDLKAENIMLERESGRALIMDFGIAQVQDEPETHEAGKVVGTPQYMSPEHALGAPVDERSDVYALGIVGYFAVSGAFPFQGTTASEVLNLQVYEPAPPLALANDEMDRRLARAVDRCLAKDADERFQSAADLAEALADRRELPVPLRVFVGRLRHSLYSGTGLALLGVLALLQLVGALVLGHWGTAAVAGGFIAGLLAATLAFLAPGTRRVLKAGYGPADIIEALSDDVDRQREELAFRFGEAAGPIERIAHAIGYSGLGLVGFGAAVGLSGVLGTGVALGSMVLGAVTTGTAGFVAARLYERRSDGAAALWLRFWKSPFGAWTAKVAGFGMRRRRAGAMHGASESVTGIVLATDRLYRNLPEDRRKLFAELPDRVRQLKEHTIDAQAFIAGLDGTLTSDEDTAAAEQRLAESVAALETLRLELQRLEDGVGTVDRVTAQLEVVRDIQEAVDRVLVARRE